LHVGSKNEHVTVDRHQSIGHPPLSGSDFKPVGEGDRHQSRNSWWSRRGSQSSVRERRSIGGRGDATSAHVAAGSDKGRALCNQDAPLRFGRASSSYTQKNPRPQQAYAAFSKCPTRLSHSASRFHLGKIWAAKSITYSHAISCQNRCEQFRSRAFPRDAPGRPYWRNRA
jgi:hypothetical protein